ncbi:MAG: hypothetical protein V1841_00550 [Patescibacteria group bacterium]
MKTIKVWIYKKISGDGKKEIFGVTVMTDTQLHWPETQSFDCQCREDISIILINLRKKINNSDILGISFEPPWEYEIKSDGLTIYQRLTDNEKFRTMTEYRKIGDKLPRPYS